MLKEKSARIYFRIFIRGKAKLIKLKGTDSLHLSSCSGAELGDSLGALSDGVLGELTGEEEADGGLDLAGGESVLLVVSDEAGALGSDLLEDIVDERVHDAHGSLGDSSVWVHLLEDSVDVDREGFASLLLWGGLSGGFLGGAGLSGSLCHFDE